MRIETEDYVILDPTWPQRMLCRIPYDGTTYYVWADCEGDACDTVACELGFEGEIVPDTEDEEDGPRFIVDTLDCYVINKCNEYTEIKTVTDAWLASL